MELFMSHELDISPCEFTLKTQSEIYSKISIQGHNLSVIRSCDKLEIT